MASGLESAIIADHPPWVLATANGRSGVPVDGAAREENPAPFVPLVAWALENADDVINGQRAD